MLEQKLNRYLWSGYDLIKAKAKDFWWIYTCNKSAMFRHIYLELICQGLFPLEQITHAMCHLVRSIGHSHARRIVALTALMF
jgi:hypothetical protein